MTNTTSPLKVSKKVRAADSDQTTLTAAKGSGILFGGKLFVYGSRFVISIFLARVLAAEQYGLYNLSLTAIELAAMLASLGLATGLVRYVPIFASRKDEAGLWGAIQIGLGYSTLLSLVTAISLFALADPISVYLFEEPRLAPILRLASLIVPFFTLSDMTAAATRGFKNVKYTVIAQNLAQPAIRFALLVVLFIIVGLNARWAVLASGVTEMVTAGILLYFLNKQFSLKRSIQSARRETREILQFSLPVYGSNLVAKFGASLKTVLLGAYGTVANVGVFALANQLSLLSDMFHSSIGTIAQPIIAELHSKGDKQELNRFYQLMTKWSVTINLPLFLILFLFAGPILALFGKSFASGETVLRMLAWVGFLDIATGIGGIMIDMTGYTRLKFVNTISTLVVSIGLSAWLIPVWGLMGAAVASLAVAIIINFLRLIEVYVLMRMLPYNFGFIKPVLVGLLTTVVVLMTSHFLPPEANLLYLIIGIAVLLVVYAGLTFAMGLSDEDRMILARFRKRLGTKFLGS